MSNGTSPSAALTLLADETRRAIFERLCTGPHAVGDLAAGLPVSRSAVSQHLKLLKQHGLAHERRVGRNRIYSAEPSALAQVAQYATALGARAAVPEASAVVRAGAVPRDNGADEEDRVDRLLGNWPAATGHDADTVALTTRFLLIGRTMEKLLARACAEHGITKVDMIILGTLQRQPAPHEGSPTQLSKAAVLSPPGITKRLDHLERRKLIVRDTGAEDRRTQVIRLTERGRRVHEAIARQNLSHNYAVIFALPPEERARLNRSLRHLLNGLEARL